MERNKNIRDQIQEKGAELAKDNKLFICQLPTGSGKGKLCMMALDEISSDRKWLIVVPELIQIENLRRDINKHGFQNLYEDKIEDIICYASLSKYKGRKLNLWLNECHRLSLLKEDIAKTIDYERIIADSATIPELVRDRLSRLGHFFEYSMTLKEAIDIGLLPEPSIHVMYTRLDTAHARHIYKKSRITDRDFMNELDRSIEYWKGKSEGEPWISNKINQLGSQRKKFLAECKTEQARVLLESLGSKRTLCYAGSVEQCEALGGEYAINSKRGKKHNLKVLEQFNSGEIDRIYMNRMGREGLNLEGIRAVVMVQLSSGRDEGLEWIQKTGRSLRSEAPEVYMLVCRDTIDETYWSRARKLLDSGKKIKYSEFGDNV